jgi:hypothetical protein
LVGEETEQAEIVVIIKMVNKNYQAMVIAAAYNFQSSSLPPPPPPVESLAPRVLGLSPKTGMTGKTKLCTQTICLNNRKNK